MLDRNLEFGANLSVRLIFVMLRKHNMSCEYNPTNAQSTYERSGSSYSESSRYIRVAQTPLQVISVSLGHENEIYFAYIAIPARHAAAKDYARLPFASQERSRHTYMQDSQRSCRNINKPKKRG